MCCLMVRLRINFIFFLNFTLKVKSIKLAKLVSFLFVGFQKTLTLIKNDKMIKLASLYQFLLILSSLSNYIK